MNFRKMFTMSISTFYLFGSGTCSAFRAQHQNIVTRWQNKINELKRVFIQISPIQEQSGVSSDGKPETGSQQPAQEDEKSKPETDLNSDVETSEEDDSSLPAPDEEDDKD